MTVCNMKMPQRAGTDIVSLYKERFSHFLFSLLNKWECVIMGIMHFDERIKHLFNKHLYPTRSLAHCVK